MVSTHDDCIKVCWESPSKRGGSRILGYILEKRKKGSNLWNVVNAMDEPIKGLHFLFTATQSDPDQNPDVLYVSVISFPEKTYTVTDVVAGMEYEFRVTAINISGAGEFSSPSEFVFARDPKRKCCNCFLLHSTVNNRFQKMPN